MSKHKTIPLLSPEKYLRTRARMLPLGTCYINEQWQDTGMAFIIVTRKHVNGNLTFATFQVDLYCLGVKDVFWQFNVPDFEIEEIFKEYRERMELGNPLVEAEYVLVHNIIYGAVEYADELGFKPHKEFSLVQYILEEDDERVELIEIEFGLDGKPAIIIGREQYPKDVIQQLQKSVGVGNFHIIMEGAED